MNTKRTIVTGQQIGLLGGPLYTTYKVLGAVHLARQINGAAVYWLESNDADFNEINHIDYLNDQGQLNTLTWDVDSHGYACGYIEVDETLKKLLETFFSTIRQTEFTPGLRKMVLNCYCLGRPLVEASLELAEKLFGHLNLRFFTPFDRDFKVASQPILRKEALRTPDGQQCNCFCMMGKQRKALFRNGGYFNTRDKMPVNLAMCELAPNVKTRSVCQDAFFHTDTYVAGPGEIKYLAELDPVYEFHGVKKAAVQPRMSITLIEPKVKRLLKRIGFSVEDILQFTREEFLKEAMARETGMTFNEITDNANSLTTEFLAKLQALGLNDVEMKPLRKLLQEEVKKTIGQLRSRTKGKASQLLKDAAFLSDNLKPIGKRQERVFNIFHYMNLFGGKKFIDWLYEHYDPSLEILEIEHDYK
ncbi:MAG: Bacillithiol biosynthesis BshC [Acidobacteriota bacterium]|nr:Bacillithiol biosynthesis BshC [Acidobacteriota bacterium]